MNLGLDCLNNYFNTNGAMTMSKCKTAVSGRCAKVNPASLDILAERIDELKRLFPETVREGQIDFDRLKKILDGSLIGDAEGERYGLSWAGKNDCFRQIQEPTTATLKPVRKESIDFDTTKNLFIEGDNLQVLKVLQKSFYGAVKMIYIDPPYNTGNDSFIYPDRFAESQQAYLKRIGDKDAEGNLIKDGFRRKNSRDAGHFHSNWLSMMYPRLFLARNLLRQDGVIFVSIDDNEVHNLRMIMNEIFGEENFVANVIWQKKYTRSNDAKWFSDNHDHILVYGKSKEILKFSQLPRTEEQISAYANPDNHPKGPWKPTPLHAKSGSNTREYKFKNGIIWKPPQGTFRRYNDASMQIMEDNDEIWFGEDGNQTPQRKSFLSEVKEGVTPVTIWSYKEAGHNHEANNELKELDLTGYFTNPKPTRLLKLIVHLSCDIKKTDIVLDFFAGSCTTAHAVMQLNAEDGGNRKFICVQMAEPCDEGSEAFKAGFRTIADIGKERIRRAAKKIAKESEGKLDFEGSKPDLGFKVFKLDESNFKEWRSDVKTAETLERQMFEFIDNVKPNANKEHILFELILKSGLDLNVPIEECKMNDGVYYRIDEGKLIISLADKITKKLVDAILKEKPEKALCLDRAFENNDQLKTNTILQMEAAKIEFKVI